MKTHLFDLKEMYSKYSIQPRSAFEEKRNTKTSKLLNDTSAKKIYKAFKVVASLPKC